MAVFMMARRWVWWLLTSTLKQTRRCVLIQWHENQTMAPQTYNSKKANLSYEWWWLGREGMAGMTWDPRENSKWYKNVCRYWSYEFHRNVNVFEQVIIPGTHSITIFPVYDLGRSDGYESNIPISTFLYKKKFMNELLGINKRLLVIVEAKEQSLVGTTSDAQSSEFLSCALLKLK